MKQGYRGPIHATHGTVDLTEIVLRDSAKLQVEAANRWKRKHPEEAVAAAGAGVSEEAAVEDDQAMPARLRAGAARGPDDDPGGALRRGATSTRRCSRCAASTTAPSWP